MHGIEKSITETNKWKPWINAFFHHQSRDRALEFWFLERQYKNFKKKTLRFF